MNELELTGRTASHIVTLDHPPCSLHYGAMTSWLAMRDAAEREGLQLAVRSGFRDFDAQLRIWNAKWRGERALLGRDGQPLEHARLSSDELLEAILTWSAIPGGSRHHWGSDLDVIDTAAIPSGYSVRLVTEEYAPDGVFGKLSAWLDAHAARFGFFRPYRTDRGGVMPEPWHLSYAAIAQPAMESLSLTLLRRLLEDIEIAGKVVVLARLPEIYTRFMLGIDPP